MAAIFRAADCRIKNEMPVRRRNEADMVERWKLAFAWTAVRRSLNSVPSIFSRTHRCKFADVEGLIRCVLDVIQKRSQGVESRLRDEISAANLADYPSLAAYMAATELRFSKLAAHGVSMTDSDMRYYLLKGLTATYDNIKASILTYRDRQGNRADLPTTISLLEDYEDNTLAVSNQGGTAGNREVALATFGSTSATNQGREPGPCYFFSRQGRCKRGNSCRFRHVERGPGPRKDLRVPKPRFPTNRGGVVLVAASVMELAGFAAP